MAAQEQPGREGLLIAGAEPPAGITQRLIGAGVQMKIEVWAGTGHFPHLAHPGRFAQRLAATAHWPLLPKSRDEMSSGEMDLVIDAHFDAERRDDIAAIIDPSATISSTRRSASA